MSGLNPPQSQLDELIEYYQEGLFSQAELIASSLTNDFPSHQLGWKVLGAILKLTGRLEESLIAMEKAAALHPEDAEAHSNLGVTLHELGKLVEAEESFERAIELNPDFAEAYFNMGNARRELGKFNEASASYYQALVLDPLHAEAHNNLANILQEQGRLDEARENYARALAIKPDYAEAESNLGNALVKLDKSDEAIELYSRALSKQPGNSEFLSNLSTAKAKAVPGWHVPMMNEHGRNESYRKAMNLAIKGDELVLDIGTGAGLLSMIAADCGAREVVTCEVSETISKVATKIVKKNGFEGKIKVINKNSKDLVIGADMAEKADILVSEILSSEFVGEGVQKTVLDAKKRLLKKTGKVIPEGGSIMIALVENSGKLAGENFVDEALGYDISDFNSITTNKWVGAIEDEPILMSEPIEAFTFNFCDFEELCTGKKTIEIEAKNSGVCAGLVQWLKVCLFDDIEYQNNPVAMYHTKSVSGWKTPVFRFDRPVSVTRGQSLEIEATLTEDYSWFHLNRPQPSKL